MSSPPAAGTLEDRKLSYASSTQDSAHDDHGAQTDGELTWTAEEEKRIVRKIDWRLMPLLWALFMLSFLDRSNIGNANAAGMSKSLKMSSGQYQWLLTIFYIGYALGQPTTLLWKALSPHVFVAILTLCWGGFALLQAAARWEGLMALRLLLGVAETAFAPGVTFFLSFFYSRREVGFRQGLYLGAAPIASCYAGALAYGISHIHNSSVPVWKLLFLIEGAPAIPMAAVTYFFLPDRPTKAKFLTTREKEIARRRTERDGKTGREEGLKMRNVWKGLRDPKAYIPALCYFSCNVSYSSLPVFLPTILTDMGFTSIRAQGLSAPPYLASFFVVVGVCWLSDRVGDRTAFLIPLSMLGGIGYLLLALVTSTGVRYFAIFLCASGIFPCIGLLLPLTASMHEDDSKRGAGFLLLNLVGQCGPFLGTRLYPANEGPYYHKGMAICCAFMFFVTLLVSLLRLILIRENRRRDALYGFVDPKAQGLEYGRSEAYYRQQRVEGEGKDEEGVGKSEEREKEEEERRWRYLL
ncbi:putative High-affinity nicotinic acid transporter (putative) [Rhodotorula toruloides]|nr:putative High-affinity nicotinic acid transporter (putative) [Rhodotorula toruloides]